MCRPFCRASASLAARSALECTVSLNNLPLTPAPTAMNFPSCDLHTYMFEYTMTKLNDLMLPKVKAAGQLPQLDQQPRKMQGEGHWHATRDAKDHSAGNVEPHIHMLMN